MSHYYGSVQGNRGVATRGGSKNSGFTAWAQNGQARVYVELSVGDDGEDCYKVTLCPSTINHAGGQERVLATGKLKMRSVRK